MQNRPTIAGVKDSENLISSLRVRPSEANRRLRPGIHLKSAGGSAVSSLSDV